MERKHKGQINNRDQIKISRRWISFCRRIIKNDDEKNLKFLLQIFFFFEKTREKNNDLILLHLFSGEIYTCLQLGWAGRSELGLKKDVRVVYWYSKYPVEYGQQYSYNTSTSRATVEYTLPAAAR